MKKSLLIILIPLIVFLQNCNSRTPNRNVRANEKDTSLIEWKEDTVGCIGLRTAEKAKSLFLQYNLKNKTADEIIELLGKPNKTIDNGTQFSLTYYFNAKCTEGKLIDSVEYCRASFFYIDKQKNDCSLSTTCQ